jgi:hypothetical protein
MARHFEDTPEFEILPEGNYRVVLNAIDDKTTKTGRTQWMFTFETMDETQENDKPFLLFARCWPNPNGFTQAFDPTNAWSADYVDDPAFDVDTFIGEEFWAEVIHTEYNSKTYANIQSLEPGDNFSPKATTSLADMAKPEPGYAAEFADSTTDFGDPFAEESPAVAAPVRGRRQPVAA